MKTTTRNVRGATLKLVLANLTGTETAREKYQPTDEDLPESFWPGRSVPRPLECDPRLRAEEAAKRLYPALLGRAPARECRTATRASLDAESGRKKYVRWKKRAQMWTWLWTLHRQGAFERMNAWERGFAENNLERFERWRERTKWITQSQYNVAESMAVKYLYIPGPEPVMPGERWR